MKYARHLPALLAALVLATPALAAPKNFRIDADHTYPSLEFPHLGLSIWRGKFNKTTGTAKLDMAAKTGSVDIEIDPASIDFGHDEMNQHAVGKDWLDVAQFPKMSYRGTLKFEGDTPKELHGSLTLKGITKPVRLKVNSFKCMPHPFYKKEACGADLEGQLDRADFGMPQYTQNGMGIITLRIQAEALIAE